MENDNDQLKAFSNLVALIYEAAGDEDQWPRLLQSMVEYLKNSYSTDLPPLSEKDVLQGVVGWLTAPNLPNTLSDHQIAATTYLTPHFILSQALQQQLNDSEEKEHVANQAIDRVPLGKAVITQSGSIVSANQALYAIVKQHDCLSVSAGRLVSNPPHLLSHVVQQVVSGVEQKAALRLSKEADALSLWITPLDPEEPIDKVIVWVSSQYLTSFSEIALQKFYGLSQAEARLAQHLVHGQTLNNVAQATGVSINTVRTQLQSIFTKVGVTRQAELVYALYTNPISLERDLIRYPTVTDGISSSSQLVNHDGGLRLPDGRWLAWADLGKPNGHPIIFMHVIAGTRYFRHPNLEVLQELGIRLIIPERPGIGDSDPLANRTVADWTKDVKALANYLKLDRFSVMGFSEGTPYALATAHALSHRIIKVFLVSAMPPVDGHDNMKSKASPPMRTAVFVARYFPGLLLPLVRIMVRNIRRDVYQFIDRIMQGQSEQDMKVFEDPLVRENYAKGLLSVLAHGESYLVTEILLAVHGWRLIDAKLDIPVVFIHGTEDWLFPIEDLRGLTSFFPQATLREVDRAGHLLMYSHWEQVMRITSQYLP